MILVTGSTGFIGSSLLHELGDEAVALRRSVPPQGDDASIAFDLVQTDRTEVLAGLLHEQGITTIVHTASVTPWAREVDWGLNLDMARTLIDVCNLLSIPKLIFISGWNVYDMSGDPPFDESTPTTPDTPYGISKLETERLFEDGLKFTKVVNLRASSIYGPGQESPGLITNVVGRAVSDRIIEVGAGDIRRDYLYIDDLTACIHELCRSEVQDHQAINIGSGASVTIREVAHTVAGVYADLNHGADIGVKIDGPGAGLADNQLDISYAQSLGLLRKTLPFKEGIRRYMKWVINRENIL